MNSYQRSVALGVVVLLIAAMFVGGTLWLRGKSLGKSDLAVIYSDIGNLKDGAPVRISGATVGRVTDIVYQGIGKVAVGVRFSEHIDVSRNAKALITSVGMLGDQVVTLDPGSGELLPKGDTIRGTITPGVFDQVTPLAGKATEVMNRLNAMLDTQLIVDLRKTLKSSQQLMAYLADQKNGPTAQLAPTMVAFQKTSARLDTTLSQINARDVQQHLDSTLHAASTAADGLARMTARMDTLMGRINRGDGTIGKLMNDTTLFTDFHKLNKSLTDLLDEIRKNPGKIGVTVRIP